MNFNNIPSIKNYPEDRQHILKMRINDIINETYVIPADSDYLIARFCGLNLIFRPFFWPALQAIEKYLKANLLYHGLAVKGKRNGFGHNITSMAAKLEKYDNVLTNLKLTPHEMHIELQQLNLWGSEEPTEYLNRINDYGDPSNRYNYFGSDFEASFLLKLDQIVFALRSNIVNFELLPKIKKNESIIYFLYEQNMCFAPKSYEHESFYGKIGINMSVPSIEAALKGLYGYPSFFENWLKDNIQINKSEIARIRSR